MKREEGRGGKQGDEKGGREGWGGGRLRERRGGLRRREIEREERKRGR